MKNPCLDQSKVFIDGEGDCWFERNKAAIIKNPENFSAKTISRVLSNYKESIRNILEIGCSNGHNLSNLCDYFNSSGFGIDPSPKAIDSGKELYKDLNLTTALASNLPYEDDSFDLVYFGFCLYLVDRKDIYKSVAEADRVLKIGGFLAILDFDPIKRHRNPYTHNLGLFSYKNDYTKLFTSSGHYHLIAKESFEHGGSYFSTNGDQRLAISVLYKEPEAY